MKKTRIENILEAVDEAAKEAKQVLAVHHAVHTIKDSPLAAETKENILDMLLIDMHETSKRAAAATADQVK